MPPRRDSNSHSQHTTGVWPTLYTAWALESAWFNILLFFYSRPWKSPSVRNSNSVFRFSLFFLAKDRFVSWPIRYDYALCFYISTEPINQTTQRHNPLSQSLWHVKTSAYVQPDVRKTVPWLNNTPTEVANHFYGLTIKNELWVFRQSRWWPLRLYLSPSENVTSNSKKHVTSLGPTSNICKLRSEYTA